MNNKSLDDKVLADSDERLQDTTSREPRKQTRREYIHSMRGKFRGKGLMKALMAERKLEREV